MHAGMAACMHASIHSSIHTCRLLVRRGFESGRPRHPLITCPQTESLSQPDWGIAKHTNHFNSTVRPYEERAFSSLRTTVGNNPPLFWRYEYLLFYFVGALTQGSNLKSKGDKCPLASRRIKLGVSITHSLAEWMLTHKPLSHRGSSKRLLTQRPIPNMMTVIPLDAIAEISSS